MLILKIIGLIIISLSWLTLGWLILCILEKKYIIEKKINSAYWYIWGSVSMGIAILFILLLI